MELIIIWVLSTVPAIVSTLALVEIRFKKREDKLTDLIWEQSGRIDVLECKVERMEDNN